MSEPARKKSPNAAAEKRREPTPAQLEAGRELLAMMLEHNPPPTAEQLAEIDREWDQG